MIHFDRYRFYKSSDNVIVAVSTFAGKTVRGVAKCAPNDTFNEERGKRLAAARCGVKISEKRLKRAEKKYNEAVAAYEKAFIHMKEMEYYLSGAEIKNRIAIDELHEVYGSIMGESHE